MERIAWSLIRSQLKSELATELRICLEALWALPGSETPFDVVLLPSNVFVGVDGTVELRVPRPADQRYFRRYLAPELGAGKPATVASAIYSVGALLFEAVSRSPFEASGSVEREVGYLAARAQATGLSRDLTDTELLEVVLKATRARPEERWGTPESFSRALDQVAYHRTATREELAWLVKCWVSRRTPVGVRPGLDPTECNRLDVLPLPFVPSEAEATGLQLSVRAASRFVPAQLRSTTLRGFSLDLTCYPPPRPTLEAAVDAPTAGAPEGAAAPKLLDRDAEPRPQPRTPSAEVNLEAPLPAPALAPRQFVPASLHDVPSVGAEPACASSDAAQAADPPSGVRVSASASALPSDRRSAALITALVVALPLVGMTLWNWRASAGAANQQAPSAQQVPSVSAEASLQRAEAPRESDAGAKPHPSVTVAPPVPVIDLAKVPAEPKRAKRQPLPRQRGPNDYGI